jgi:hypothetical protein
LEILVRFLCSNAKAYIHTYIGRRFLGPFFYVMCVCIYTVHMHVYIHADTGPGSWFRSFFCFLCSCAKAYIHTYTQRQAISRHILLSDVCVCICNVHMHTHMHTCRWLYRVVLEILVCFLCSHAKAYIHTYGGRRFLGPFFYVMCVYLHRAHAYIHTCRYRPNHDPFLFSMFSCTGIHTYVYLYTYIQACFRPGSLFIILCFLCSRTRTYKRTCSQADLRVITHLSCLLCAYAHTLLYDTVIRHCYTTLLYNTVIRHCYTTMCTHTVIRQSRIKALQDLECLMHSHYIKG